MPYISHVNGSVQFDYKKKSQTYSRIEHSYFFWTRELNKIYPY